MSVSNMPNLRKRRKELRLTLKDVADFVGVSEGTVSRWETGNISSMRQNHIALLAKVLNTSTAWILGLDLSDALSKLFDDLIKIADTTDTMTQALHGEFDELKKNIHKVNEIIYVLKSVSPNDYDEVLNFLRFLLSKK